MVDNLNTRCSASLVRYVADAEGFAGDLGEKEQTGILQSMASRAGFLSDPTHQIVFHCTPEQASCLNQVEIWLGILVRKVLRRSSFRSVVELEERVLAFIAYFNATMPHPFKWTYQGKPLQV